MKRLFRFFQSGNNSAASSMTLRAVNGLLWATIFWSLSFPLVQVLYASQRMLLPDASALFLSSLLMTTRFALAAIVLALWCILRDRSCTRNEAHQGLLLAFYGGLGMWLQADALAFTKASTCAFLTQAYCVFLPLVAAIRHRRAPTLQVIIAVALVMLGIACLSGVKSDDIHFGRGEIETILCAVAFTMQILCLDNPKFAGNRPRPMSLVMFGGIALMTLPFTMLLAPEPAAIITALSAPNALWLIFSLSILCSVIAYGLMNRWQPHLSPVQAGLTYSMEPVFTAGFALFLPAMVGAWLGADLTNETITSDMIIGGILITLANLLILRYPHSHPQE
jgi:drug/metabolite transporter (DMT)-like permease